MNPKHFDIIIIIIIWFSLFEDQPSHVVVVLIKDVDVAGVSETFHDDEEDRQEKDGNDNEQDEEYYVDNDENDEDHKDEDQLVIDMILMKTVDRPSIILLPTAIDARLFSNWATSLPWLWISHLEENIFSYILYFILWISHFHIIFYVLDLPYWRKKIFS